MAEIKPEIETFANIKVVGVGGSGGSAINRMVASKIRGVEFIAMNTDVQALHYSQASVKLHIGKTVTRGLGAGMDPEVGARAAEESQNEIREALKGADMVFVTCGMGGGSGSGAGPKIAEIARELGALTVAVVTRPFSFEGAQRKTIADGAYDRFCEVVDTIITIPNDRVLQIIDRKTSLLDAFEIVDDVLRQGVQGISELITVPGLINVDFADVRAIMANRGSALMGIGRGSGENRAADAAKAAIASPLLEVSIDGAKGILFTITGGSNLGMYEVSEAAKVVTQSADPNAKVIFGAIIDETLKDEVKVTVIATGFDSSPALSRAKTLLSAGILSQQQAQSAPIPQTPPPQPSYAAPQVQQQPPQQPPSYAPSAHQPHIQPVQLYQQPQPQTPPPAPIRPPEPLEPMTFNARPAPAAPRAESVQPRYAPQPVPQQPQMAPPIEEEYQPPVPPPAPVREPDPQPSAHQPHVQAPNYAPVQQSRQMPVAKTPVRAQSKGNEEDDLEIPAFIRRKMM